jgi:hypothetical protein
MIGASDNGSGVGEYIFKGFISNARLIKGTALYTSDFIPPTRKLTKLPGTVLLCCTDSNDPTTEATGKTITANGDPTATRFTPSIGFDGSVTFDGVTKINTENYFYLPTGPTEQRFPNFAGVGGGGRGVFGGGQYPFPTKINFIDYITIATTGNAQEFGDLTVARGSISACSSNTRGVWAGGTSPSNDNTIDYITISSTGNAQDFGDLQRQSYGGTGASNSTRGLFALGQVSTYDNTINYITISTSGISYDYGDLVQERDQASSCASSTRGIFAGGLVTPTPAVNITNRIDYVTISTTGNAFDFGDLISAVRKLGGLSNSTRGIFAGGEGSPFGQINTINYITIASTGNAQDFGDIFTGATQANTGTSSSTRGVFHLNSPSIFNSIHYVTISTLGNSQDFGDLTTNAQATAACSDSHGGLG